MSHPDPLYDPDNSYEDDMNYDDYNDFNRGMNDDADVDETEYETYDEYDGFDEDEDDGWNEYDSWDEDYDDSMDGDHDSAMESAGWGTDEDYGYYGEDY